MNRFLAISLFLLPLSASLKAAPPPQPFDELSMIYETNVTDGDAEIVIAAQGFEGLKSLFVRAPTGRVVALVHSNDRIRRGKAIGLAEVIIETGEPDIDSVKAAYPEGTYQFFGRTVSGVRLFGEVVLSHDVLPAAAFTPNEAEDLDPDAVVVQWAAVPGAAGYIVEIENDDLDVNVTAKLPGTATSFAIPAGFLAPGTEYEVGVATITEDGNLAFAESSFTTAGP
jgi:hypothetical protein